ncbi:MAG TPA: extracellular solute-binding protein [Alphaproteobacteria bacterium]|jgi:ABC-type Fe3+ transport system substrate-binding protein
MRRNIITSMMAATAVICSMTVAAQAQVAERTPALEQMIKDAQKEGQLNVIWGSALGAAEGAQALQDAMNKAYGLNIKINYTPGPNMNQMTSRIVQEVQAGRPASSDLYIGVEVAITELVANDVLAPVEWAKYFPYATGDMVQSKGRALLITTLFNGITYNSKLIPKDKVPKTMAEVFRPEWKGKIASTSYAASFDRLALKNGLDKIKPIVEKTAEWASGFLRCGEAERIATGEFLMLFLDCGRVDEQFLSANGGPLDHAVLTDAAATSMWYAAIPKTSVHPNLAKLLSGYIVSQEGQALLEKYQHATSHLVPGTSANKIYKDLEASGYGVLALTPDDMEAHQKELLEYKKAFEKILATKAGK